eukprot:COSAG06_NODE_4505_length_4195_cov_72.292969_1_plen_124_part_00
MPSRQKSSSMSTAAAAAAATAASAGAPAAASAAVVRLYIFRHGVSEWNLLKKWQGVQDTQLAPEGIAQAKEAAAALADGGLRFQRAFSSDLCRARQTAEILSAACSDEGAGELRLDERLQIRI